MKIFLQPGYVGRETNCVVLAERGRFDYSRGVGDPAEIHIGSVEFVESVIGYRKPDFYPSWTRGSWHRDIRTKRAFVKSARSYKNREAFTDIVHISEPVKFVDEWRHYVADGVSLCSWWYQGSEETCENDPHGPGLPFEVPEGFCGAIDIGRLDTGEIALVEVQHPYAIGWYGDLSDNENYLQFLIRGWKSLHCQ